MRKFHNFIGVRRKNSGLTSREVAALLGMAASSYSELESGLRRARFDNLLALAIVFGESLGELYPEAYDHREEQIMAIAKGMEERLRARHDEVAKLKLRFLEAMAKRALNRARA